MSLHPLLTELPVVNFGRIAAALMPVIDDLSAAPWRSHDFPGGSTGPITIAISADGAFAAYGDDDEDYSHLDLIRRVNASVQGLPAGLARTRDTAASAGTLEGDDRERLGLLRARRIGPSARDKAIREQATSVMDGIGEIELYMLIRLAVVDSDICCWLNREFSWRIQPDAGDRHAIHSLNVGNIAWGLADDEAQFLLTAGQRIFAKQREGYDV